VNATTRLSGDGLVCVCWLGHAMFGRSSPPQETMSPMSLTQPQLSLRLANVLL
jgi:hypothetical protein